MNPIGLLLPVFKYSYKNIHKGRIIKMNAVLLIGVLVIVTTFPWRLKIFSIAVLMVLIANLLSWGIPYLLSIKNKNPLERAHQIVRDNNEINFFSFLDDYVKKEYHLIIIVAFLFPLFLSTYGQGKASSKTEFQYIKGHTDLIVIRKYSDLLVCKKADLKNHKNNRYNNSYKSFRFIDNFN